MPRGAVALVFSNEVGEPLRLFHRTWQTLVLRAHGHTATWAARLNYQGLSDQSQDAFRKINLRWHDLRHCYASRLVAQGVPLAQVRDLLGHASITTTERYDNQTLENLQLAVRKLERGHAFAGTKFQDSFKIEASAAPLGHLRALYERPASEAKELKELDLQNWLGRRDSSPFATRLRVAMCLRRCGAANERAERVSLAGTQGFEPR